MSATVSAASGPLHDFVVPWIHTEALCDGCRAMPIYGYRFKSLTRPDYDICSKCFRRESPLAQLDYLRIERCQASKPYQITYVECHGCGAAPIKGHRYQHRQKANLDLCGACFEKDTSLRRYLESDFEEITETMMTSKGKQYHPALHFEMTCDGCLSTPIVGPCYTSIRNSNYDLCAHCHHQEVKQGNAREEDFLLVKRPSPALTMHINIIRCMFCGAFPISGPRYTNWRKEHKNVCILCCIHIKEEKKCHYSFIESPLAASDFPQAPQRTSSSHHHNSGLTPSLNPPQRYGHEFVPSIRPNFGTGPPLGYPQVSAAEHQELHNHSAAVHSQSSQPSSYPGQRFPPATHHTVAFEPSAAKPNNTSNMIVLTPEQQLDIISAYLHTCTTEVREKIQKLMQKLQYASEETQSQFLQLFAQYLVQAGGGYDVNYSFTVGAENNKTGAVDYSTRGAGDSIGIDFSSFLGGASDGSRVVDFSSTLTGGDAAGITMAAILPLLGRRADGGSYRSPSSGASVVSELAGDFSRVFLGSGADGSLYRSPSSGASVVSELAGDLGSHRRLRSEAQSVYYLSPSVGANVVSDLAG